MSNCLDCGHPAGDGRQMPDGYVAPDLFEVLQIGAAARIRAVRWEGCQGLGANYTYVHVYWLPTDTLSLPKAEEPPLPESVICMN